MSQITGNLSFNMSTNVFSTFVQDDWQIAPTVKILYGVRYDLYKYPDGHRRRAAGADARVQHRQEQLRPARRRRLGARSRRRCCAPAPASCTTSRFSAATSRRCSCRGSPRAPVYTFSGTVGRRAGVSRRRSRTGTLAPAVAVGGRSRTSRWRTPGRPTRSSSARSAATSPRRSGLMYAKGNAAAGRHRRQPDQPDRHARRRPADLQHGGQRGDARSIRASTTSSKCSRSASRRSSR